MTTISAKVRDRLVRGLRKFQPVLEAAKSREAREADTSALVRELLAEMFGYDRFAEMTAEKMIRGTYCDIALKMGDKITTLIEVKAIYFPLKDAHVKQAVDYASNQGVEWVFLTNGAVWRIYRILFQKPISSELIYECDLLSINPKKRTEVECLFLFTKEGHGSLEDISDGLLAKSRYHLGAVVLSEPVLRVIRNVLRRVFPKVKIDTAELHSKLHEEVLKREVTGGEKADEARRRIGKALKAKSRAIKTSEPDGVIPPEEVPIPEPE